MRNLRAAFKVYERYMTVLQFNILTLAKDYRTYLLY